MSESWITTLPADLQSNATLTRFQDVPSLAKSYLELNTKLGQRQEFSLPTDDAGLDKVFKTLRPADPTGYELPGDNGKAFAALAHENGLHPKQAKTLFQKMSAMQAEADSQRQSAKQAEQEKAKNALEAHLKAKFGDKVDAEKQVIQQAWNNEKLIPKALREALEATGLQHHPALAELVHGLGQLAKEGNFVPGSNNGGAGSATDVQSRWTELMKFRQENIHLINSQNMTDELVVNAHTKLRQLMNAHAEAEIAAESAA